MPPSTVCPPVARLKQYLDDALDGSDADGVAEHIDGCSACHAALDRLTRAAERIGRRRTELSSIMESGPLTPVPDTDDDPDKPESTRVLGGTPVLAPPRLVLKPDIPGYTVEGELGRGGMGVVYRGTHKRLNRPVAIKMVLAGGLADPRVTQRFLFEAEVLARVAHPQVVRVYEVSMYHAPTGVAVPYLVMELLDGITLHEMSRAGRRPVGEVVDLVEGLARAAHAAHSQGIVHRDIKPANVLRAAGGPFKLADFGLAKLTAESGGLTGTGTVVGTPQYMAPEQASGSKEVGPAADVYSLGAILYELLAGQPPFTGGEPMSLLMRVIHEPAADVRSLVPAVPRDLAAVAMTCLAKDPRRRYATAEALADDLARFRDGKPTRARPLRQREKVWLWARRNPAVAGLMTAIVLVVVAAGGSVAAALGHARDEAVAAREAERKERENAAVATAAGGRALESARAAGEAEQRAKANAADAVAAGGRATDSARAAVAAKAQAESARARLLFGEAVELCEAGRVDAGLRAFLEAIERAGAGGDPALADLARVNVRAWAATLYAPPKRYDLSAFGRECLAGAYSPDGKHLALCGRSGSVRVFDAETAALVADLRRPRGYLVVELFHAGAELLRVDADTLGGVGRLARDAAAVRVFKKGVTPAPEADGVRRKRECVEAVAEFFQGMTVRGVAFDRTGTKVCAGDENGRVCEWDLNAPRAAPRECQVPGFIFADRAVNAVACAADGSVWFAGSGGRVWRWDPRAGPAIEALDTAAGSPPVAALPGLPAGPLARDTVDAMASSPDGKTVYTGDRSGRVIAWDAADRRPARAWSLGGRVNGISPGPEQMCGFTPGTTVAAAVTTDGTVAALGVGGWDAGNPPGPPWAAALADLARARGQAVAAIPDGPAVRAVVAGDGDGNVRAYDTQIGHPVGLPLRVDGSVRAALFRPRAGRRGRPAEFAVVAGAGAVAYPLQVPASVPISSPTADVVTSVAVRWDGTGLVACGPLLGVMRHADGPVGPTAMRPATHLTTAVFHPRRDVVLFGAYGGWGAIDLNSHTRFRRTTRLGQHPVSIAVRPATREVYVNMGTTVLVYGALPDDRVADPGVPVREVVPPDLSPGTAIRLAAFAPDGSLVVAHANRVDFLDPVTGARVRSVKSPTVLDEVLSAAVSPDRTLLATGHRDNTAQVWDLRTGAALFPRPIEHPRAVTAVAVRSDGKFLATGCRDGTVHTWDVAAGLPVGPRRRHKDAVTAIDWVGDAHVISGTAAGTAAVWPVAVKPATDTLADLRAKYGDLENNTRRPGPP